MKKILSYLMLFTALVFTGACSSDDNENTPPQEGSGLTLTSDQQSIFANNEDKAVFTVTNAEGQDVTASCTFMANGEELFTNEFSTDKVGNYTIVAQDASGNKSNELVIGATSETANYVISSTRNTLVADGGDLVKLTMKDEYGVDLTGESVFYVDGEKIEGNVVRVTEQGSHNVSGEYKGKGSERDLVLVGTSFREATGRLLVDYYTSTDCQYCPQSSEKLKAAYDRDKRFVLTTIHPQGSTVYNKYTTQTKNCVAAFESYYKPSGTPAVYFSRDKKEISIHNMSIDMLINNIPLKSDVAIAIQATKTEQGTVDVKAGLTANKSLSGKVVVMLVETGVYARMYGQSADTEQVNLMRDYKSSFDGSAVELSAGKMVEHTVTFQAEKANLDKSAVIVFVTNAEGKVENVQYVSVGDAVGY